MVIVRDPAIEASVSSASALPLGADVKVNEALVEADPVKRRPPASNWWKLRMATFRAAFLMRKNLRLDMPPRDEIKMVLYRIN